MNKVMLMTLLLTGLFCHVYAKEPIAPLVTPSFDQEKAKLGEKLFSETRLSSTKDISCASCHDVKNGGADPGKQYSTGVRNTILDINTPTILTAALNFKQFWDGRADTLSDQVTIVLTNPKEMDSNWPDVLAMLRGDQEYVKLFEKIYQAKPTHHNVSDAISHYQISLAKPSRFDDYLNGDQNAITDSEKEGYKKFKKYGCSACHQGMNIGGNMYQSFGILGNYFNARGNITKADFGRFNITGKEYDRYQFKVPSLRNIELTAPYFHDGQTKTLREAVDVMFRFQLGRPAPDADKEQIIEFLKTLNSKN